MGQGLAWSIGVCLVLAAGGAAAQNPGLDAAARNYPPLIVGANTRPTDGKGIQIQSCPAPGARVEQKGGPTFDYLGANPATPDLCRMRVGGEDVEGWYGIWLTVWPGAETARSALQQVIQGRTGDVVGFDVRMTPTASYHDLVRNEGVEDIRLLSANYRALKLSHYREGFGGNTYRSVSTVWKDLATGMLIYGTYQHISGAPEIDDPLLPTAIIPAPR